MTIALPSARAPRALVACVLACALVATAAPAAEALGRLVRVIVVADDAGAAATLTRARGGLVDHELPIADAVAARVPESRLAELAAHARVVPDRAIRMQGAGYGDGLATAYPHEVGATDLWGGGVTGAGVTVALVDTGVAQVPDLAGRIVGAANLSGERGYSDAYGHGTFQAGLIAGDGASSGGRYVGVAPDANILSVKVADGDGETSLGQVLAGVQLVDWSASRFDVRVLLLAIDSGSPLPPELDPLSTALRRAWAHGVVVVVPAGNGGPDPETVASPGEDPVLLTAGSVDDLGTPEPEDDVVSDFTARGPTRWGADKPDLAAPGEHLVSLRAPGSTIDRENPSARVDDGYFKGSGTSMSAAVTAGAAALLLSERPDLNPDEVKALLQATATAFPDGEGLSAGAGIVDAARAAAFDGDLPELPDAPDVGDASSPFFPPGLEFDWMPGDDGIARWAARRWAARRWAEEDWDARRWAARRWVGEGWFARSWAARRWTDEEFAARAWAARSWAARSWAARSWAARSWAARRWTAEEWEARSWAARRWTAEEWEARAWSARSWAADDWEARAWSARSWSARAWSARAWCARAWG